MEKPSPFGKRLIEFVRAWKKTVGAVVTTGVPAIVVVCFFAFYYFSTPANAIIITTTDLPAGLAPNFTLSNLSDQVVGNLQRMIELADSGAPDDLNRQQGFGPSAVKQTILPIRAVSDSPAPFFDATYKGISLNRFRRWAMGLRGRQFLELGAIGVPQGGWRLTAFLKARPHYLATSAGSAPQTGGACADLEKCTSELTEQILGALDSKRLLNFYIKVHTPASNHRILEIYQATPAGNLEVNDLVAWGNAFYELGQYDQALQKYQDALDKSPDSCDARVARGFVYSKKSDLKRAEQDFRGGIHCEPTNALTHAALGHTLLLQWSASVSRDPASPLLVEAKAESEKALEINPKFVTAGINVAYILYRQGKEEEALNQFDSLSQRFPTNSPLFLNYGFLEYREYLKDKSADTLNKATHHTVQSWTLNPTSDAANNLGYFYYEQGNYADALNFWAKAHGIDINDPDPLAGLALGTYKRGDRPAAVNFLQQAIEKDPHYRDPAYLKAKVNWSDRAASDLAELIKLLPPA
jgi:tetratricopeptide (TPR) repeat protein